MYSTHAVPVFDCPSGPVTTARYMLGMKHNYHNHNTDQNNEPMLYYFHTVHYNIPETMYVQYSSQAH